jgi:dTDP-4-dehydrorhamnose 3,5-epimerase
MTDGDAGVAAVAARSADSAARKDAPQVRANWEATDDLIDGVVVHEVRNVVTRNGITTELLRADWGVTSREIVHAIHVSFRAGALAAWHMHRKKTDYIFVTSGLIKLVLFDDRTGSPTRGRINELFLSLERPRLIVIPPAVFHGLQALGGPATFVNYFDHQYQYDNPDEYRLPPDAAEIPYRFV